MHVCPIHGVTVLTARQCAMLTVNVAFRNLYYCLYCLGVCGYWGRTTQERLVTWDLRRHAKTSESFLYLNVPSITCEGLFLLRINVFYSLVEIPSDPQLSLSTRFVGCVRDGADDQILTARQDLRCDLERINT